MLYKIDLLYGLFNFKLYIYRGFFSILLKHLLQKLRSVIHTIKSSSKCVLIIQFPLERNLD